MPDPMKTQYVFFEVEKWEGDGTCLTTTMLRNAARRWGRTATGVAAFHTPVVHPDAWKALMEAEKMAEEVTGWDESFPWDE
jgi:hypothetical protein